MSSPPKPASKVPRVSACNPAAVTLQKGVYFWCACGHSRKQPFCDGAHQATDFVPMRFVMEETKEIHLCQCKHTKTPPYCDGTHEKLAAALAAAIAKKQGQKPT